MQIGGTHSSAFVPPTLSDFGSQRQMLTSQASEKEIYLPFHDYKLLLNYEKERSGVNHTTDPVVETQ